MSDFTGMSLQQLQQYQEQAKLSIDSIMSCVSDNKYAVLALYSRPDFAELLKSKYGLSQERAQEFMRKNLGLDETPAQKSSASEIEVLSGGSKTSYTRSGQDSRRAPAIKHTIYLDDCRLVPRGYPENAKIDKSYLWRTPIEYVSFWNMVRSSAAKNRKWEDTGILAVHFVNSAGARSEYVVTGNGFGNGRYETLLTVHNGDKASIGVYAFPMVKLLRRLISLVYDELGDNFIQALWMVMQDSKNGVNDVPWNVCEVLSTGTELVKNGADLRDKKSYIQLPGKVVIGDTEESLYINNAVINEYRAKNGIYALYDNLSNEKLHIETVCMALNKLCEGTDMTADKFMEKHFKFLMMYS